MAEKVLWQNGRSRECHKRYFLTMLILQQIKTAAEDLIYNTFCYSMTVQLLSTVLIFLLPLTRLFCVCMIVLHSTCPTPACNLCNLSLVCFPLKECHVFLVHSLQWVSFQTRALPALTDPWDRKGFICWVSNTKWPCPRRVRQQLEYRSC